MPSREDFILRKWIDSLSVDELQARVTELRLSEPNFFYQQNQSGLPNYDSGLRLWRHFKAAGGVFDWPADAPRPTAPDPAMLRVEPLLKAIIAASEELAESEVEVCHA